MPTTKQRIIELLRHKTTNLSSIAKALNLSASTIHEHLAALQQADKIECYRLSSSNIKYYKTKK